MSSLPAVIEQRGQLAHDYANRTGAQFTADQIDLIKRTVCKGGTDDELALFLHVCKRVGLDPLAKQIYAVKRWDKQSGREVMSTQTGIDGFRVVAERTGRYEGQDGPYFCGEDGVWSDVWLKKTPPLAAKVGVFKTGFKQALYRIAKWDEYVQMGKEGPTKFWKNMPCGQLAKCAEALALRSAFPQDLSGVYTSEEMEQADSVEIGTKEAAQAVAQAKIAELQARRGSTYTGQSPITKEQQAYALEVELRAQQQPGLTRVVAGSIMAHLDQQEAAIDAQPVEIWRSDEAQHPLNRRDIGDGRDATADALHEDIQQFQPKTPRKPSKSLGARHIDMMQAFGILKKRYQALNVEKAYYAVLGRNGVEKSNQFPATDAGLAAGLSCYREMQLNVSELEAFGAKMAEQESPQVS